MILRQEDFTQSAIDLGVWAALLDLAKISVDDYGTEIEILEAHKSE